MAISACLPAQHTGKTVLPVTAQQRDRTGSDVGGPSLGAKLHPAPAPSYRPQALCPTYASEALSRNGNKAL